jgi:ribosomal protein S14
MAAQRPTIPPHARDLSPAEARYLIDLPYAWNDMLIDATKLSNIYLGNLPLDCELSHTKHTKSALGCLGYLPTEVICSILENTDLLSIMCLRVTSTMLRCIINDWEPFREVVTAAPEVLKALLATKAAAMFTASRISKVVFTTQCELCGECGNFLQLLKLARCCFRCLANDRRLLSVPMSFAQSTMGLNPTLLPRIPHLTTISRTRFWGIRADRPSCCAVDYNMALKFARPYPAHTVSSELEPQLPELPTIIRRRRQKAQHAYQRKPGITKRCHQGLAVRPLTSYPIATIQPLVMDVDINPPENEMFRFLSAMDAPGRFKTTTFDPLTNTSAIHHRVLQHGYCKGCRFYWNLCSSYLPLEHTIYNSDELPSHIQSCFYARLLWGRLYPGGRIDDVLAVMLLKQHPAPFKLRHPAFMKGNFEKIPPEAIYAYATSNPTDNGYGDLLLGSRDSHSQATWATRSTSTSGALQRSLSLMTSRKSVHGADIGAWKKASQMQFRRPTKIPEPQCVSGLPISLHHDPDHTFFLDHNGEQISLWFEEDNTRYPVPLLLDALGQ